MSLAGRGCLLCRDIDTAFDSWGAAGSIYNSGFTLRNAQDSSAVVLHFQRGAEQRGAERNFRALTTVSQNVRLVRPNRTGGYGWAWPTRPTGRRYRQASKDARRLGKKC